jgi:hypothetical protein
MVASRFLKTGRSKIMAKKRYSITMLSAFVCLLFLPLYLTMSSKTAHSCFCGFSPTVACDPADCASSAQLIPNEHSQCLNGVGLLPALGCSGTPIMNHIGNEFDTHENWLENTFVDIIVEAMQKMATQLSAISMNQTMNIGMFFDAKESLETNRLMQELQVQAHEDYQPSESFCTFGTAVRSMAHTEEISTRLKDMLNTRQMARHLGIQGTSGAENRDIDKKNRFTRFVTHHCDAQDNNWIAGVADSGLTSLLDQDRKNAGLKFHSCLKESDMGVGFSDELKEKIRRSINIDVEYTRAVENPRSLYIVANEWPISPSEDEMNILALGNNLYGHNLLTRNLSERNLATDELAGLYLELRSIAAKRSVAENTFNSIVALKSMGTNTNLDAGYNNPSEKHLGKILQDLGIPEDEVTEYLGLGHPDVADPGYMATMEILTKKIFQNPTFYANLYDTPANVQRKAAALKAFELMLDRSIYESQLRREMAMSVLLATRIESNQKTRPSEVWGQ